MTVALLASKLIFSFEGCRLTAYQDSRGTWTVGFGHTGSDVERGLQITYSEAETLFEYDAEPMLSAVAGRPLIEAAALVSFGYNCGLGALQRVLRGEIQITHEEFMASETPYGEVAGGTRPPGLMARRNLEAALIEASRSN